MKFRLIAEASTFLLLGNILLSQNPRDGEPVTVPQRIQEWMSQMDQDGNESIDLEEAAGLMKRNFERIDSNNDKQLDRSELRELATRLTQQARTQRTIPANTQRNRRTGQTDEQVLAGVPDGVQVELNIPYREGNDAWKLDLAMPEEQSDTPRPAIVFVHGGGWTGGDKRTPAFLGQALEFAARGYVCITVNYRLDETKLQCVEDVKCSVRWLRAHAQKYNLDPDRIGAYGNSAGAHLVTMLGVSYTEPKLEGDGPWQDFSSRVQAVVASATPTSPRKRGEADYDEHLIQPMSYITRDAPPFLLVHEESDKTVPVSNSDDFVKAMKEAGARDITYKRYTDGSGHGVFQRNIDETGPLMEAFFKRVLGKK